MLAKNMCPLSQSTQTKSDSQTDKLTLVVCLLACWKSPISNCLLLQLLLLLMGAAAISVMVVVMRLKYHQQRSH